MQLHFPAFKVTTKKYYGIILLDFTRLINVYIINHEFIYPADSDHENKSQRLRMN